MPKQRITKELLTKQTPNKHQILENEQKKNPTTIEIAGFVGSW